MSSKNYDLRSNKLKRKEKSTEKDKSKESKKYKSSSDEDDFSNISYSTKASTSKNSRNNIISFNLDIDSNENSLASNSSIYVNTNQTENENSDKSLLSKIYEDGKNGFFKPKLFEFGEESKSYTPVVNFFKCETNFECRPSKKIKMKCLICNKNFHAKVGRFTNLNRHISSDHTDSKTVEWYEKFSIQSSKSKETACLDDDMLLLIKYFYFIQ